MSDHPEHSRHHQIKYVIEMLRYRPDIAKELEEYFFPENLQTKKDKDADSVFGKQYGKRKRFLDVSKYEPPTKDSKPPPPPPPPPAGGAGGGIAV